VAGLSGYAGGLESNSIEAFGSEDYRKGLSSGAIGAQ